jgi:trimethylamine--corrinoid protein Co-methyltransferase
MKSQSRPELIDRQIREVWEKAGATTAYERAVAKAKWILENHKPEPLPDNVLAKIRAIIDETEKEMGIKNGDSK